MRRRARAISEREGPADAHAPHGVPEALGRRAHHLVGTCLFPGDVMVPRFLGARESYFAVAATDRTGMQSLCTRIRGQLAAWVEIREARIRISVRGRLLERSAEDRAKPDAFAEAARAIERWTQIDSHWSE
jgi:hypothetical protein